MRSPGLRSALIGDAQPALDAMEISMNSVNACLENTPEPEVRHVLEETCKELLRWFIASEYWFQDLFGPNRFIEFRERVSGIIWIQ